MSPTSGTRAQKQRRAAVTAAKERRKKIFAFGGLGVLAILLVIQGPRIFDAFGGSTAPTAAPEAAAPTTAPDDTAVGRKALGALRPGSDPFATRSLAGNDPAAGDVAAPRGLRDPFGSSGSSAPAPVSSPASPAASPSPAPSPLPRQIVLGTPTAGVLARRGWIVVLASIQTRVGRAYAQSFAARVQRSGLGSVSVLDSSTRKPLRAGYYVVYTGPFATLDAVQRSAAHVHAFGYRTAYIREILSY
ncbi:MAG: hypothetical protein ABIR67_07900 [Gaiellaceae bacterium]